MKKQGGSNINIIFPFVIFLGVASYIFSYISGDVIRAFALVGAYVITDRVFNFINNFSSNKNVQVENTSNNYHHDKKGNAKKAKVLNKSYNVVQYKTNNTGKQKRRKEKLLERDIF